MEIFKEFKEFAVRGNVIDLSVGVVIGAAFGKIVASFVDNILTPPIGYLVGSNNLNNLKIQLNATTSINYGAFLQTIFDFLIIAFTIFILIKGLNKFRRKTQEIISEPQPTKEEILLTEIRDLLKKQNN